MSTGGTQSSSSSASVFFLVFLVSVEGDFGALSFFAAAAAADVAPNPNEEVGLLEGEDSFVFFHRGAVGEDDSSAPLLIFLLG